LTFFLGILVEAISYFRYQYQANAYANLAIKQKLTEG
jgi:hypothetical protein